MALAVLLVAPLLIGALLYSALRWGPVLGVGERLRAGHCEMIRHPDGPFMALPEGLSKVSPDYIGDKRAFWILKAGERNYAFILSW